MGNCYSIKTTSEEDTAASEEVAVSNPVEDENNNVGGAYVYASDLSENRDREFQDRSRVANSALDHAIRAWIVDRYYLAQPGAWSPRPNNARRNPSAPRMQNALGEPVEMINSSDDHYNTAPRMQNVLGEAVGMINSSTSYVYVGDFFEIRDREFQDTVANSTLDHAIRPWIDNLAQNPRSDAWSPRLNNALARRNPSAPRMQNGLGEAFEMINSSLEADAALTVLDENSSTGEMTKSSVAADDESSSAGICIRCPVCLDGLPVISSSGRSLMSTVCGHIFCSRCIPASIRSNGRCPTCRRILFFPYHVHPIFI